MFSLGCFSVSGWSTSRCINLVWVAGAAGHVSEDLRDGYGNKLSRRYGVAEVTTRSWSAGTHCCAKEGWRLEDRDQGIGGEPEHGMCVAFLSHGENWEISSRYDGGVWRGMI